jgi:hypothetical protein
MYDEGVAISEAALSEVQDRPAAWCGTGDL